jgi:phosphate starvation-inducible PhoH-like protein
MQIVKEFENKSAFLGLIGPQNVHLKHIEAQMGVSLQMRGNQITIEGSSRDVPLTAELLDTLYQRALKAGDISNEDIERAVLKAHGGMDEQTHNNADLTLRTRRRHINPRSQNQAEFINAMNNYEMVFGLGPAGTG